MFADSWDESDWKVLDAIPDGWAKVDGEWVQLVEVEPDVHGQYDVR